MYEFVTNNAPLCLGVCCQDHRTEERDEKLLIALIKYLYSQVQQVANPAEAGT